MGGTCWGGQDLTRALALGPSPAGCDRPCTGNATDLCGGPWANAVYVFDNSSSEARVDPPGTQRRATLASWGKVGCFNYTFTEIISTNSTNSSAALGKRMHVLASFQTPAECAALASTAGFWLFAILNGSDCLGTNHFLLATAKPLGDPTNTCDGIHAMAVYSFDLPSVTTSLGCWADNKLRMVPVLLEISSTMTTAACASVALAAGYPLFATQGVCG